MSQNLLMVRLVDFAQRSADRTRGRNPLEHELHGGVRVTRRPSPVTSNVYLPHALAPAAVIVSREEPPAMTTGGSNVADMPGGRLRTRDAPAA